MDPEFKGSNGQNISVTLKILMRHITNANLDLECVDLKKKGSPFNSHSTCMIEYF